MRIHKRLTLLVLSISALGLFLSGPSAARAQGDPELNRDIARLRMATAQYHDLNTAIEDGFTPLTGVCHVGEDGNTVGISYVNIPRFVSAEINPDEPEFLNYIPIGDGNVRLVGIAYGNRTFFRDTRPPSTPGYRPGVFVWTQSVIPPYLEEVSGSFSLFGQQARPTFSGRWLYLLSVWAWDANPNGIFADGNPHLTCPATQ